MAEPAWHKEINGWGVATESGPWGAGAVSLKSRSARGELDDAVEGLQRELPGGLLGQFAAFAEYDLRDDVVVGGASAWAGNADAVRVGVGGAVLSAEYHPVFDRGVKSMSTTSFNKVSREIRVAALAGPPV